MHFVDLCTLSRKKNLVVVSLFDPQRAFIALDNKLKSDKDFVMSHSGMVQWKLKLITIIKSSWRTKGQAGRRVRVEDKFLHRTGAVNNAWAFTIPSAKSLRARFCRVLLYLRQVPLETVVRRNPPPSYSINQLVCAPSSSCSFTISRFEFQLSGFLASRPRIFSAILLKKWLAC